MLKRCIAHASPKGGDSVAEDMSHDPTEHRGNFKLLDQIVIPWLQDAELCRCSIEATETRLRETRICAATPVEVEASDDEESRQTDSFVFLLTSIIQRLNGIWPSIMGISPRFINLWPPMNRIGFRNIETFGEIMNKTLRFAYLLSSTNHLVGSHFDECPNDGLGYSLMQHQDHIDLEHIRATYGVHDFGDTIKLYFSTFWAEEIADRRSFIHNPASSSLWRTIESFVSPTLSEFNESASAWRVGPAGKGEPMDVRCSGLLAALKQDLLSCDVSFSTFRCSEKSIDAYEGSTLNPKLWKEAAEVLLWMQDRAYFKNNWSDNSDESSSRSFAQMKALGKKSMHLVLILSLASWEQLIYLSSCSAFSYLKNVYMKLIQGNIFLLEFARSKKYLKQIICPTILLEQLKMSFPALGMTVSCNYFTIFPIISF
jgi:hypothetical protein